MSFVRNFDPPVCWMGLISRSLLFVNKVNEILSTASIKDWMWPIRATGGTGSLALGILMSYRSINHLRCSPSGSGRGLAYI